MSLEQDDRSEGTGEEPEAPRPAWRRALIPVLALAILAGAFFGGRLLGPMLRGEKPAAPATTAAPAPAPEPAKPAIVTPAEPEPTPDAETSAEARKPRRKTPPPAPAAPAAPAPPTTGELRIDSDVPGAMVFLDRVFLGNAPVVAKDVKPGTHHINASADGHDAFSGSVEVSPGPSDFMIRFKEIRLNASIDVVHKHGMGSCEGRLVADPKGVRYETTNKDDGFVMAFGEIDSFEVDYLKKNLKLKRRGGKTYNFSTKAENADPLFVFHRDVDKVRKQVTGK